MIVIVAPYQVLATPPNSEGHWQDFRGCSGWTCWWQTWVPWVRPRQAGASSTLGRFRPCVEAGIPASWAFSWALVLCSLGFSQVTSDQKHAWVMVRLCSGWLRDPRTWCAQACVTVTWGQVGLSRPRQVTWVVVHPVGCPPPTHISPRRVTTVQRSQSIGFSLLSRCYPGLSFPWTGVRTSESHLCSAMNSPSEYAPGSYLCK